MSETSDIPIVSVIERLDENTEIHKINNETYLFNKKENTYEPICLQYEAATNDFIKEDSPVRSPLSPSGSTSSSAAPTGKEDYRRLWDKNLTLFFIQLVQEKDEQFQTCVKKQIWIKIANQINEDRGTNLTWQQCETKWKGLSKLYREIVDHNKTSGKQRRKWDFFDAMHAVLFKKPEITPVATCSSSSGLQVNNVTAEDNQEEKNEKVAASNFIRKRKSNRPSSKDRRHEEKMMRQDRFNNLFEKYIDILQNKQGASE